MKHNKIDVVCVGAIATSIICTAMGISKNYIDGIQAVSKTLVVGMTDVPYFDYEQKVHNVISASAQQPESEGNTNKYADLAITNVNDYVNVRTEPNTNSKIVGKLYDGSVAQILSIAGEEDDWLQVVSGNVEGYVKAEFFLYGDAAAAVIDDYVIQYAVVMADRLYVRRYPDIDAKRIGYIDNGERVKLVENQGEWLKVQYTEDTQGYVAAQYVTIEEQFIYAKTLEEEAQELAAQKALKTRVSVSEAKAPEDVTITATPPDTIYSGDAELRSNTE